jgi:hypothetical protein
MFALLYCAKAECSLSVKGYIGLLVWLDEWCVQQTGFAGTQPRREALSMVKDIA